MRCTAEKIDLSRCLPSLLHFAVRPEICLQVRLHPSSNVRDRIVDEQPLALGASADSSGVAAKKLTQGKPKFTKMFGWSQF